MTINTNTTKNAIELRTELLTNGTRIEHIIIDGQRVGILGTTSEADKQNAIRTIEAAINASNGNIYEAIQKLTTIATMDENNISPDEVITVDHEDYIISYTNKTAYTMDAEEYVNCTDLPEMPKAAIKAVLVARIEAKHADEGTRAW
jgi:hypothetical protein